MDPLMLARLQFALNISFHIIFPSISIALCWFLLFFKIRYNQTQNIAWQQAYQFWVKIFALTFALGVGSGITMSFQFGTNWPGYMESVGNIAGPLLGYEVLSAFFLEATFLAVMLFGQNRVSPRMHTLSVLLVSVGTTLSAFWIIALNSWMQTPQGFEMIDGKAFVVDWIAVIFNPSMTTRLIHMLLASGLTTSFLVAGISAYQILKQKNRTKNLVEVAPNHVFVALKTSIMVATILIPLQIFMGDRSGLEVLEHQPEKLAAIEAIWETETGAALNLVAFPDEKTRSNHYAIAVPKLGSIILTHSLNGEIKGLNEFAEHPPVAPVFWSFRIMVGAGVLMLLASWVGSYYLFFRKTLSKFLTYSLVPMVFSGIVAVEAGWYVTEIGRQPWLVYGVLKTKEAVAAHTSQIMLTSFIAYTLLYIFLLISYFTVIFYLAKTDSLKYENQHEEQNHELI